MKLPLNEMTWKEAEQAFKKTDIAIVPTGAIHPHGLGCPLGTDNIVAQELAKKIAERTDVIVLPLISYGYTEYHGDFPGTISISRSTYFHMLLDICNWLHLWGIKKVIYIVGHGGDIPSMEEAAHYCRSKWNMLSVIIPWWTQAKSVAQEVNVGTSEGLTDEMSALLYLRPDVVHVSRETFKRYKQPFGDKLEVAGMSATKFRNIPINIPLRNKDVSDSGGFGPPESRNYITDAKAELGERLIVSLVDYIVDFIHEFGKLKI